MNEHESKSIAYARLAITDHAQRMGLENETEAGETNLWHLVFSLLLWCDAGDVDFDALVADVRAEMPAILGAR